MNLFHARLQTIYMLLLNSPLPLLVSGVGFAENEHTSPSTHKKAVLASSSQGRPCFHPCNRLYTLQLLALSEEGCENQSVRFKSRCQGGSCPQSRGSGHASVHTCGRWGVASSKPAQMGQLSREWTHKACQQKRWHRSTTWKSSQRTISWPNTLTYRLSHKARHSTHF